MSTTGHRQVPERLVLVAHGTRDPRGRAAIGALAAEVAAARPGAQTRLCFVDVQPPRVGQVLRAVADAESDRQPARRVLPTPSPASPGTSMPGQPRSPTGDLSEAGLPDPALTGPDHSRPGRLAADPASAGPGAGIRVIPLLLTVGYHVRVDIGDAVRDCPGARAAPALGPDPVLTDLLARRLRQVGAVGEDAIVLAAAGSSDPDAGRDVGRLGADLRRHTDIHGRPFQHLTIGFGASAEPSVAEAVRRASATGRRVVVAAYLLAPGYFYDVLSRSGADLVTAPLITAPLAPDPALVRLVLDRADGV
ncbi:MAG: sirohydrochlorin chelatase [Actinomycetales bacterium]